MPDPPEWREPKHRLPDGSVTQLLLIHSAEHKTFLDKKEKIALDDVRREFPPPSRYYREREDENEYLYGHSRGRTEWVDERNTNSKSRNNGHPEAPPKSSGLITFPFFTWRVKHGTEGRQPQLLSIQERDETVVRILGKIHESITSDKSSYRRLYAKAYRCGADDLFLRHPDVVVKTKTDASPEDHDGAKPADELPTSPSGLHN
ncbi:hypothetical protein SLS63_007674 [Diaporthe eres]|uniref:Uncharacterized protein n=1 Tax=Diaporthe eres TaxID=83184 RepID=A0ABR1P4W7_DIAER